MSDETPRRRDEPNSRLRSVPDPSEPKFPRAEAEERFKVSWKAARKAYAQTVAAMGGPWVLDLLSSDEALRYRQVRSTHAAADKVRVGILEVLAHLDRASDAFERCDTGGDHAR